MTTDARIKPRRNMASDIHDPVPPAIGIMNALAAFSLDELEAYGREHPPQHSVCRWCGEPIVSTPWFSPSRTFYLDGGGWMHERTETSPCGAGYPYRFAEPIEIEALDGAR